MGTDQLWDDAYKQRLMCKPWQHVIPLCMLQSAFFCARTACTAQLGNAQFIRVAFEESEKKREREREREDGGRCLAGLYARLNQAKKAADNRAPQVLQRVAEADRAQCSAVRCCEREKADSQLWDARHSRETPGIRIRIVWDICTANVIKTSDCLQGLALSRTGLGKSLGSDLNPSPFAAMRLRTFRTQRGCGGTGTFVPGFGGQEQTG